MLRHTITYGECNNMVKIDIDRIVDEINSLVLVRSLVKVKLMLADWNDARFSDPAQFDAKPLLDEHLMNWEAEQISNDLKAIPKLYKDYINLINGKLNYESLVILSVAVQRSLNALIENLIEKIMQEPCEIVQLHQLVQQYGAYRVENMLDVVSVIADIYYEEPKTVNNWFILVGPHGRKFYLVPKKGYSYEVEKPHKWFILKNKKLTA